VVGLGMLVLPRHGYRPFELAVTALLGLVACGFVYDLLALRHRLPGGVLGGLVPSFGGGDSVTLAVGLLGATVMPHVVYLHGALVVARGTERGGLAERLRSLRLDCVLGIGLAGLVNVAMLCVAGGACGTPRAGWPRWRSRWRCSVPGCRRPGSARTRAR
jgi:manganese transport protein